METQTEQNDTREMKLAKLMIKWLVGASVLLLIPIVFPVAMIAAIVYYIPVTLGGWVYDAIERWMK